MSRTDTNLRPRVGTGPRLSPMDELRRRAAARLAERLDPAKTRFKPLSLLRMDARRAVEQFLDTEAPALPRPDRDKMVDELLADAAGLGPLEELFRDEAVQEFMTLAHNQVVARKGEHWLPTSVHLPTPQAYRQVLAKLVEGGDPAGSTTTGGGVQVKLPNGFRLLAVFPPAGLDHPPTASFLRGKPAPPPGTDGPTPKTDIVWRPVPPSPSGTVSFAETRTPAAGGSVGSASNAASNTPPARPDPFAKVKQKVTERLIGRLSAAGVYDINKVPGNELRLVVTGFVEEILIAERLSTSFADVERLALEILKGMHR